MKYCKIEAIRIKIHKGPLLMDAQKIQLEKEIKAAIKYDCDVAIDHTIEDVAPSDQDAIKPSIIKMAKIKVFKKRFKLTVERM